jgi:hypothetical protein
MNVGLWGGNEKQRAEHQCLHGDLNHAPIAPIVMLGGCIRRAGGRGRKLVHGISDDLEKPSVKRQSKEPLEAPNAFLLLKYQWSGSDSVAPRIMN